MYQAKNPPMTMATCPGCGTVAGVSGGRDMGTEEMAE